MIEIKQEVLNALLRCKGMMTITELSKETEVNRFTLHDILIGKRKIVQKNTYSKLVTWLSRKS